MAKKSQSGEKRAARAHGEQEKHYWVYDDLVKITGKNRLAIWKAVSRGEFETDNLKSVVAWCVRHATEEFKFELLPYVMLHAHAQNPAVSRKKPADAQ